MKKSLPLISGAVLGLSLASGCVYTEDYRRVNYISSPSANYSSSPSACRSHIYNEIREVPQQTVVERRELPQQTVVERSVPPQQVVVERSTYFDAPVSDIILPLILLYGIGNYQDPFFGGFHPFSPSFRSFRNKSPHFKSSFRHFHNKKHNFLKHHRRY